MPISIERIVLDEENVNFPPGDSFLLSYREFVHYYKNLDTITSHNFVIGAHFTYGWMPRILKLHNAQENFPLVVDILNEVKSGRIIGSTELLTLRDTINNSLVGASKLLSFTNPNNYAIWDRRVYTYINGHAPHEYQIRDPANYLAYLSNCEELTKDEMFKPVHASMNEKIGYEVTPYRAVELVMFMNGG